MDLKVAFYTTVILIKQWILFKNAIEIKNKSKVVGHAKFGTLLSTKHYKITLKMKWK